MDPQQLQKRIEALEKQVASLNQSSTISYQVENAFQNRGFLNKVSYESIDPLAYDNLNTLVPTPTGDFPVIAFPVRWLKLKDVYGGGGNYLVPVYTLVSETP
jgi:hypothetical protein